MDAYRIVWFDTEVNPQTNTITDIGAIDSQGNSFHNAVKAEFRKFLESADVVCGHNVIAHDLKFVGDCVPQQTTVVDTLPFSPLLFPKKPYHKLVKDDKLYSEELNNPLNDARKAKILFDDEIVAWQKLSPVMQTIFTALLRERTEFKGFLYLVNTNSSLADKDALEAIAQTIEDFFHGSICASVPLVDLVAKKPVELAYALALIHCDGLDSITPPWVVRQYPLVESAVRKLCGTPCLKGCSYCNKKLNARAGLKKFFGFDAFRSYAGEPLQEDAARAALEGKSLLAVFPTGGGKSVTFQVPALMAGENEKGLTVVISPLQSLMKDQVDNLEAKNITRSVAISGLLDPIERAKAIERVRDGSISLLYIAPESLRSKTIENLLLQRNVVRFVIDEAHCFSAWGHDFRPDYLYIGDFIKAMQEQKGAGVSISVSCFTATAKARVVEDICAYFNEKLRISLTVFLARSRRENLHYIVLEKNGDEEKYNTLRELIDEKNCPTIIYVSRTKQAARVAERLTQDGIEALAFHGKMDREQKIKNQQAFISGEAQIMVATSAFGMGVDKKDVGLVIHHDISDSLENYVQESGRAGRSEDIQAACYILFNENDLNKHFLLLNQTKLNHSEIQQIWKAIKEITHARLQVEQSALEIARTAGWKEAASPEIETRVLTAITALEQSGYIQRKQNSPRVYATSIRCKSMAEASEKIANSKRFETDADKSNASRIMVSLFGARSRKGGGTNDAESRVDYICDNLGIAREDALYAIQLLREEGILADQKDLSAHTLRANNENKALRLLEEYIAIEKFLLRRLEKLAEAESEVTLNLKAFNEYAHMVEKIHCDTQKIRTLLNYWEIKHFIRRKWTAQNTIHIALQFSHETFLEALERRFQIARQIITYVYKKQISASAEKTLTVAFSIIELMDVSNEGLYKLSANAAEIEEALFYLSRIGALKIEGGFMVLYNRLTIERKETNNRVSYKQEDYKNLADFYESRIQQIHIVGEYANKMHEDNENAVRFVDDYFQLNYAAFLRKYFPGSRQLEIRRNITPQKYRQLFDALSEAQRAIIDDKTSATIVVAAGPGSGKTKLLVHKLAALLLMEDVKHEQLLMLTFSRAAATEFKKRLIELVGNAANFVDIKTFHSYCFDILGRVGTLEKTDQIIQEATLQIKQGTVEQNSIARAVLVIDEAQDMSANEFALVKELIEQNENIRIIAVGDDDQNIYEFRGSHSKYFAEFSKREGAVSRTLLTNYRARANLVDFSNQFIRSLSHRMKESAITANTTENGQITLIHYASPHLAEPLVQMLLKTELQGTTAILTRDNTSAETVVGLLHREGYPARLIQSNDNFSLSDIDEVRFFIRQFASFNVIPHEEWKTAQSILQKTYPSHSRGRIVCEEIIRSFESVNPHARYRTDLEIFVRESRLEDFSATGPRETVCVSTMHKAKGREFDNVFLLVTQAPQSDEDKRLLYVAMTRARKNLVIHTTTNTFDAIQTAALFRKSDTQPWNEPSDVTRYLTHRDVWLDFFSRVNLKGIQSGSPLHIIEGGCTDARGQTIVRFSKSFMAEVAQKKEKGFALVSACVHFVLWWKPKSEDTESENLIKIILPEIVFRRE